MSYFYVAAVEGAEVAEGRPFTPKWRGKWSGLFEGMVTPRVSFMHPPDFFFNTSTETFEVSLLNIDFCNFRCYSSPRSLTPQIFLFAQGRCEQMQCWAGIIHSFLYDIRIKTEGVLKAPIS